MARARNIKPGFFRNEELADLDPLTRLLFAGLWTVADRAGRLEDRPRRIKADILPYDEADVDAMLDALAEKSFIARYKHGAAQYIQIINFDKHQNPHKNEAESAIPPMEAGEPVAPEAPAEPTVDTPENPVNTGNPPEHRTSTVQAPESHSTNRADSLNTDSLNTDSLSSTGADAPERSRPNYSESFEKFWEAYPSGHGVKKTAYEQWKRLKPDDLLQRRILAGLERWKACERWQDGFVKSAHIWLRERWWENDPPPPRKSDPKHLHTPNHDEPFDFFAE